MGTGKAESIRNLAEAEALKRYVAEVRGVQLEDATFREIVDKGLDNAKIEGIPVQYRVVRQVFENNNYYILLLLPKRFSTDPRNIIYPEEELCDPLTGIRKTAEPAKIGESYSFKISPDKPFDLEIVTPADGNLTLSLESFAEYTSFVLYNKDGVLVKPTNENIVSAGQDPTYGRARYSYSMEKYFNNDNFKYYFWNTTVEKFKGSFTYKVDAGAYYFRIVRGQTGLSTFNLSTQFKALK